MLSIDELIEQIRQLSPAERGKLLRRLRINGLINFDEPVTDQDPLNVATALGLEFSDQSLPPLSVPTEAEDPVEAPHLNGPFEPTAFENASPETLSSIARPTNEGSALSLSNPEQTSDLEASSEPAATEYVMPEPVHIDLTKGNHLAPSSGKVVVGAPQHNEEQVQDSDDPHAMAPVPGQGPSGTIKLVFDGGSKGNPGYGYGSYSLEWPGLPAQVVRLQHGNDVTNNEAEYDTLLKALQTILKRLDKMGAEPSTAEIDIRGDSLLVINQVIGEWKCKHDRLKRRRDKIRAMLDQFEYWELRHHDRENSVRILGH